MAMQDGFLTWVSSLSLVYVAPWVQDDVFVPSVQKAIWCQERCKHGSRAAHNSQR